MDKGLLTLRKKLGNLGFKQNVPKAEVQPPTSLSSTDSNVINGIESEDSFLGSSDNASLRDPSFDTLRSAEEFGLLGSKAKIAPIQINMLPKPPPKPVPDASLPLSPRSGKSIDDIINMDIEPDEELSSDSQSIKTSSPSPKGWLKKLAKTSAGATVKKPASVNTNGVSGGGLVGSAVTTVGASSFNIAPSNEPPIVFDPDYIFSPADSLDNLVFSEGESTKDGIQIIRGGTLAKLVERLTFDKYVDTNYLQQFLLTYRTFTTPRELLGLLYERYNMKDPTRATDKQLAQYKVVKKVVRLRVFNVLKTWLDKHYYDFAADAKLLEELDQFIDILAQTGMANPAEFLRDFTTRKRAEAEEDEKRRKALAAPSLSTSNPLSMGKPLELLKVQALEVAKQMTLLEFDIYQEITPSEFNNQAWNKGTRQDKLRKAPHVIALIERFNQVSNWVATTLVFEEDLETRRDLLVYFVHLANHCRELHNFNGMMSVISGMTATSTYRLKKTWALLDRNTTSIFNELNTLLSRDNNFRNFRMALHAVQPPALPYLGVYLTDLIFVDQGNSDLLPGTQLINFYKRRLLSSVMREIQQYQQLRYTFPRIEAIIEPLMKLEFKSEEEGYIQSLKIEPREETVAPKTVVVEKALPPGADPPDEFQFEYPLDFPFQESDTSDNISFMDYDEVRDRYSIRAGTLEKLVERLTYHRYPDSDYVTSFLLTFRSFMPAQRLFDLLLLRFNTPLPINCLDEDLQRFKAKRLTPIRLRVANVLKNWVDKYFFDFAEDRTLVAAFLNFVKSEASVEPPLDVAIEQLRNLFKRKLKEQLEAEATTSTTAPPAGAVVEAESPIRSSVSTTSVASASRDSNSDIALLMSHQPAEFAQQLAILHKRAFQVLDIVKLLISNLAYHPSPPASGSLPNNVTSIPAPSGRGEIKLSLFSSEVISFQYRIDALTNWIISTLLSCTDLRERVEVTIRFIEMAETSRQLCDFASMFALVQGLSSPPVKALKRLWNVFPSKPHLTLLADMQKLIVVREGGEFNPAFQQQMRRAAASPTVLYLKPYLEKLGEISNDPDFVSENKLINFDKRRRIGVLLQEITMYQKKPYDFVDLPAVQEYINNLVTLPRESMDRLTSSAVIVNETDETTKFSSVGKQSKGLGMVAHVSSLWLSAESPREVSGMTGTSVVPSVRDSVVNLPSKSNNAQTRVSLAPTEDSALVRSPSRETTFSNMSEELTREAAIQILMSDADFRQDVRNTAVEAIVGGIFRSQLLAVEGRVSLEDQVAALREEVADESSLMLLEWSKLNQADVTTFTLAFIQEHFPGALAEIWTCNDAEGEVYGWPEELSLCVVRQDDKPGVATLVDVRPTFSEADVAILLRKKRFYESQQQQQQQQSTPVSDGDNTPVSTSTTTASVSVECVALVPPMAVRANVLAVAAKANVLLLSTAHMTVPPSQEE